MPRPGERVLVTGATGFVGGAVRPALRAAGWQVRCLTRSTRPLPADRDDEWAQGDIADEAAVARALTGCRAALYLVHQMGDGDDFHRREVASARSFARAAAAAGVKRIVYLGGMLPRQGASEHLQSRREVGEALRAGPVPAVELRASMIIGHGSLSWLIVRDLAARLPVMVLPSWLKSRTQPVAIDDVVVALVRALEVDLFGDAHFDLPGPETLSGAEILDATARALGLGPPWKVNVPLLTPRLSSLWVRFVTRARWSVARQVVIGLTHDLVAKDEGFWPRIGYGARLPFAEAARRALAAEPDGTTPGPWGVVERMRKLVAALTPA
ncbi:MAG TPA: NAD(P)H-binding protein [Polyangia bacterium]|nr:NAD(P)H-binding protein [Polyangia bacterium]